MFSRALTGLAALTLLLAGCGTKGPLTLPPKTATKPPAVAAPAPVADDHNKAAPQ
jgi:predicted small lipoprotein YifL